MRSRATAQVLVRKNSIGPRNPYILPPVASPLSTKVNARVIPAFDIFRVVNGQLLWVDAVPSLDIAQASVRQLMSVKPAEYMILSQKTRNKISLKPGESTWSVVIDDSQFLPRAHYRSSATH